MICFDRDCNRPLPKYVTAICYDAVGIKVNPKLKNETLIGPYQYGFISDKFTILLYEASGMKQLLFLHNSKRSEKVGLMMNEGKTTFESRSTAISVPHIAVGRNSVTGCHCHLSK